MSVTDFSEILAKEKNVLIATAHPDDSAVILGGSIQDNLKNIGQDHVFVAIATDGEANESVNNRTAEEIAALDYLGVKKQNIFFAHLPDGGMSNLESLQKYADFLKNLCLTHKITAFITLGPKNDKHPDHIATHLAAVNVCKNLAHVRIFALNGDHAGQYSLSLSPFRANKKFTAASFHKSQYSEPGWLIKNHGVYSMGPKFGQASNFYPPLQYKETFDLETFRR